MIEYYHDTMTPAQHEERARRWAARVAGLSKYKRARVIHTIARVENVNTPRVWAWVRWAEQEGKNALA